MKYLTTLEVARELGVSKQTVLNWLYAGKVPEPPRNKKGYRLWSSSRLTLVRRLIAEGRLHKRTVVHRVPANRPDLVNELAREVIQFLRDAQVDPPAFLRELARCDPGLEPFIRQRKAPARRPAPSPLAPKGGAMRPQGPKSVAPVKPAAVRAPANRGSNPSKPVPAKAPPPSKE